ncbi:hypothetical protein HY385_01735 [Candidatus Daviesbacteria bacterium]|nr:hypothetical protein [Candidatus Daviesbacteria bacterium]
MRYLLLAILLFLIPTKAFALVDPLSSPNNQFGVHIITPSSDEASPAAVLVNSSGGDWGYITVLIERGNQDKDKWQKFFNDLRQRHLIPIVRIATEPLGNYWQVPNEGDENTWADFLDSLVWPTKNRYVVIYNEPNQGQEWGGKVDAPSYAKILDKTVTALKAKNQDFFILNAGLDVSAPQSPPQFADALTFLNQMDQAVPGIFNKLDGWVSHSYPNPGFVGSPDAYGRGTIRSWAWEQQVLQGLGVTKTMPVFITETGWKHAEGLSFDKSLPSAEVVANYLKKAFLEAWQSNQIVAVTPFLLNYQENPFDHFSFKKPTSEKQNQKILGATFPEYYPTYQTMVDLPKTAGRPIQENKAQLIKGTIYPVLVAGENYHIPLTFKNTGQSIWGEYGPVKLQATAINNDLTIDPVIFPNRKIDPGQEITVVLPITAPQSGTFKINLQLFAVDKAFDQPALEFATKVEPPVSLVVKATLAWKKNFMGKYLLSIISDVLTTTTQVNLDSLGKTDELEAKYLLPEHQFKFTLQKPYYHPKTIELTVKSGVNELDFGKLQPSPLSAIFHPTELFKLLPFLN